MYRDSSRVLQQLIDQSKNKNKNTNKHQLGLKSLALAENVKNKSKTFAVVCETLKFKQTIDNVLSRAKINPNKIARSLGLMYVMLYDHLFGKGIRGGGAVKRSIVGYDEQLRTALGLLMKEKGVDDAADLVSSAIRNAPKFPRYARVNLLTATVDEVLDELKQDTALGDISVDPDIPYLLRFQTGTDLHAHPMVLNGKLILQDKSSCFPAHALYEVLKPALDKNSVIQAIDATAAPGNKTSQLAALGLNKVFAFDKDARRLNILKKRMVQAKADSIVEASCRDFLSISPSDDENLKKVKVVLLDPSCSGSGMIGRVDHLVDEEEVDAQEETRLAGLSKFQKESLLHALGFPNVDLVSYSTCSIHKEENELVVEHALRSNPEFQLAVALSSWPRRGDENASELDLDQTKRLVRVDPREDMTCGFFVAVFVRKGSSLLAHLWAEQAKKRKMKERRKRRRKTKVDGQKAKKVKI
mmetsp:Transcript_30914/g.49600  ORF Transcript_30914/g.49600 Transcript_30914/m.49600 type:complete len:471 (-) Transcript_30914:1431-2843(-)